MTSFYLLSVLGEMDDRYILEAHRAVHKVARHRRILPLVAVLLLLLALCGCVLAYYLSLQDLKLSREEFTVPASEFSGETVTVSGDMISMQGVMHSPNYQAAKEWRDFTAAYDPDYSLLAAADATGYNSPMEYMAYNCYTPEMEAKIDEICEKYQLQLQGPITFADNVWQTHIAVGVDSILSTDSTVPFNFYESYYYWNGSFSAAGELKIGNGEGTAFQYYCVMKNVFDTVALNVGNIEDYEQWPYQLSDGTELLLAIGPKKALVLADRPGFFATVNVLLYGEEAMTKTELERFADQFTFAYTPQPVPEKYRIRPEWFGE